MSKIKGNASILDTIKSVTSINENKSIATTLLENLRVYLGGFKYSGYVDSRVVSLVLPLEENSNETKLYQFIRGNIQINEGARGLIVIQSSGVTKVVNDFSAITNEAGDFEILINVIVPPDTDCHTTLYLLVTRDIDNPDPFVGLLVEQVETGMGDALTGMGENLIR